MAVLVTSCLFDASQRCSEGQEYSEEYDLCLCAPGMALTEEGCQKCGRNEIAGAAGCECKPGFERAGERCERAKPAASEGDAGTGSGAEPEAPMSSLGKACTSNADCEGTDAEFCDTFVTMSCLVMGCELGGTDCPPGYGCQDLSTLGAAEPVCAAAICDVAASNCPDGFTCCQPPIPGFPAVCLSGGCGG